MEIEERSFSSVRGIRMTMVVVRSEKRSTQARLPMLPELLRWSESVGRSPDRREILLSHSRDQDDDAGGGSGTITFGMRPVRLRRLGGSRGILRRGRGTGAWSGRRRCGQLAFEFRRG